MHVHIMRHTKLASVEPKKWVLALLLVIAVGILILSLWQSFLTSSSPSLLEEMPEEQVDTLEVIPTEVADESVHGQDGEVTFVFGGDLQFDRYIRTQAKLLGGYDQLFTEISSVFTESDGVIANLEGPVTSFESVSVGSAVGSHNNYLFTFSSEVIPVLEKNNFVLVNIGNNHIRNFGEEGVEQTMQFFESSPVKAWGSVGGETWLDDSFVVHEQGGLRFLFVNYNEFLWGDVDELIAEVPIRKAASQADFVVLYTHWGVEYQTLAGEYYRELARRFVAAGADMIVGSHPHVVQQHETIGGAPVYYSLGNFVFDQYFEQAVRQGLLLKATFKKSSPITVEEVPIYLEGTGKTVLILPN